jgi:putative transposase
MSHRYRLYPTPEQEAIMREHCAHTRFVWNLCVEQQSWWRPGRKSAPGWVAQSRQLTEARAEFEWLRAGSREVQGVALRDFDRAMSAFFNPANPARKPSYRSAKRGVQGFAVQLPQVHRLNRRWGETQVPKVGWVRFRLSRPLPAKLGMPRVTLNRLGRWHVTFQGPQTAVARESSGGRVGIDRGVRTALVTSDGQHFRAPRISDRDARRYVALARKRERQKKGSVKRKRTVRAMAAITTRGAGRRKDWAEKVSTRLVREHDLIVLEKLDIRKMTRKPAPKPDPKVAGAFLPNRRRQKAGLSRGILAACWGTLAERLEQKAAASGVTVLYVDPCFTSQQCHVCGHIASENRESQAVFVCVECGHEDHADANAARNILARGLIATGGEIPAHAPGHGAYLPRQSLATASAAGTTRSAA